MSLLRRGHLGPGRGILPLDLGELHHLHPELLELEKQVALVHLRELGEARGEVSESLQNHVFPRAVLVDVRHRHAVDVEELGDLVDDAGLPRELHVHRAYERDERGGGAVRALQVFRGLPGGHDGDVLDERADGANGGVDLLRVRVGHEEHLRVAAAQTDGAGLLHLAAGLADRLVRD